MTPTRSATASASSWSWVTNSVVVPTSSWIRRISSRSCTRTLASSADSGSSSSSTCGCDGQRPGQGDPLLLAAGDLVRRSGPPASPRPDQLEHLGGPGAGAARRPTPRSCSPNSTFCRAVMCGNRLYAWNTMPMSRLLVGHPGDVLAADLDPARVGVLEAGEQPQRGGLAAAGGAEQRDQLAGLDATGRGRRGRARRRSCGAGPSARTPTPWVAAASRTGARCGGHVSSPCERRARRPLPTKDMANSTTNAKSSAASDDGDRDRGVALAEQVDRHLQVVAAEQAGDGELAEHQRHRRNAAEQHRRAHVRQDHPPHHGEPARAEASGPPRPGCATSMARSPASSAR